MAPKLYGFIGGPAFRAVLMCARALELELETEFVDLINGEHLTEDFIKKNPQHTVPLLEDNGFYLADSHAINGYLVSKYGQEDDSLYPIKDIERRATIDHRQHLDSSIIAAAGLLVSKPLAMEHIKPDQKSLDRLRDAFSILDKLLEVQNTSYIVGDNLSIADFNIVASVSSWKYFVKNWADDFPHIKSYLERLTKEDFYQANLEGLESFNSFCSALLN